MRVTHLPSFNMASSPACEALHIVKWISLVKRWETTVSQCQSKPGGCMAKVTGEHGKSPGSQRCKLSWILDLCICTVCMQIILLFRALKSLLRDIGMWHWNARDSTTVQHINASIIYRAYLHASRTRKERERERPKKKKILDLHVLCLHYSTNALMHCSWQPLHIIAYHCIHWLLFQLLTDSGPEAWEALHFHERSGPCSQPHQMLAGLVHGNAAEHQSPSANWSYASQDVGWNGHIHEPGLANERDNKLHEITIYPYEIDISYF